MFTESRANNTHDKNEHLESRKSMDEKEVCVKRARIEGLRRDQLPVVSTVTQAEKLLAPLVDDVELRQQGTSDRTGQEITDVARCDALSDAGHGQTIICDDPLYVRKITLIQRQFRRHRLQELIRQLRRNQSWLFHWDRCTLDFYELQRRMRTSSLLKTVRNFLELLGSVSSASNCHAKLLLMANMLNHYSPELGMDDEELKNLTKDLGKAFVDVCESPECWFKRMMFMVAYSRYATKFLDWKAKDQSILIEQELSAFERGFDMMWDIKRRMRQGKLGEEKGLKLIERLKMQTQYNFLQTARLLGCSQSAKEMAQKRLARRLFLKDLSHRLKRAKVSLEYIEWVDNGYQPDYNDDNTTKKDDTSDHPQIVRLACAQYLVEQKVDPPQVGTKDEWFPGGKEIFKIWYGRDYAKVCRIKDTIAKHRLDLQDTQNYWLPDVVAYVKQALCKTKLLSNGDNVEGGIDMEFLCQQCCLNNCDGRKYMEYFLVNVKKMGRGHGERARKLLKELEDDGLDADMLLKLLQFVDEIAIDTATICLKRAIQDLDNKRPVAENEMMAVVDELQKKPEEFDKLYKFVTRSKSIEHEKDVNSMSLLSMQFCEELLFRKWNINGGDHGNSWIEALPITFRQFSISILRLRMMIHETVVAFCLVQFIVAVTKDESWLYPLKCGIFEALKIKDKTEQVKQLYRVVMKFRPEMEDGERQILEGLTERLIYQNDWGTVGGLALDRIRKHVQYELRKPDHKDAEIPPFGGLVHFQCEMTDISKYACHIWNASAQAYKLVYNSVLSTHKAN